MTAEHLVLTSNAVPYKGVSLNPFIMVDDALGLITFVTEVFGVAETLDARTPTEDGRLIHSEVRFGSANLMIVDRLDGWPARPGLLQVWVADINAVLDRAVARGATTVTDPMPFYGETSLARMLDKWGNLWWLWMPVPGQPDPEPNWESGPDAMFTTLDEALRSMAEHDRS